MSVFHVIILGTSSGKEVSNALRWGGSQIETTHRLTGCNAMYLTNSRSYVKPLRRKCNKHTCIAYWMQQWHNSKGVYFELTPRFRSKLYKFQTTTTKNNKLQFKSILSKQPQNVKKWRHISKYNLFLLISQTHLFLTCVTVEFSERYVDRRF